MKRKIKILFVIILSLFIITGCTNDSVHKTSTKVATKMAKCMSKGDYKCAASLVYLGEKCYIDEVAFTQYIKDNNLNIKGNNKIDVEKSDINKNASTDNIKVKIDKNRILEISLIKDENNKWYVDLGNSAFSGNMTINVPKNTTVKLNGYELDKKLSKEKELSRSIDYYSTKVKNDSYNLKVLEGKYGIEINKENTEPIKDVINSSKYEYSDDKGYFTVNSEGYTTNLALTKEEKAKVLKYINDYYTKVFNGINKKEDYSKLSKNYVKDLDISKFKSNYDALVKKQEYKNSYSIERYTNIRVNGLEEADKGSIYYLDDDHIVSSLKVKLKIHHYFEYNGFMASSDAKFHKDEDIEKEFNGVIDVKKVDKGYIIVGGKNLVPYLYI